MSGVVRGGAVAGLFVVAAVASMWAGLALETLLLGGLVVGVAVWGGTRYPEVAYALFVTAGVYKADDRLQSWVGGGVDLTLGLEVLCVAGVALGLVRRRIRWVAPPKGIALAFGGLVALGAVSLVYTPAPTYGLEKLLRLAGITGPALFLALYVFQRERALKVCFAAWVALGVLMTVEVLGAGAVTGGEAARSAFGSNYLALGRTVGAALVIIALCFALSARSWVARLSSWVLVPLLAVGVVVGGGRGPVMALVVTALALVLYAAVSAVSSGTSGNDAGWRRSGRVLAAVGGAAVISMLTLGAYSEFPDVLAQRVAQLDPARGYAEPGRADRFAAALESLRGFPEIVAGLGIGGFSVYYGAGDAARGDYPHNVFLEVASELGLVGLGLFIAFLWMAGRGLWAELRKGRPQGWEIGVTLGALFVFTLANALVSGDINDNRMLFSVIGMALAWAIPWADDSRAKAAHRFPGCMRVQGVA